MSYGSHTVLSGLCAFEKAFCRHSCHYSRVTVLQSNPKHYETLSRGLNLEMKLNFN